MSAPVEPATQTFAAPQARDVLSVRGRDAVSYLQGQLSQDVDALAVGTSAWSFVLQPQGRVDAWFRITKVAADGFVLDVDGGHGPALADRVRRFMIRTDATVEPLDWSSVAVRGPDAPHDEVPAGVYRLPLVGPGVSGYDLVGPGAVGPDGVAAGDETRLELDRIAHGVPRMGNEIDQSTIPAELGAWIIEESVSFAKGCYTGQELTARIDSRGGNVPHRLWVVALEAPVATGATGAGTVGEGAAAAVEVTSVVERPDGGALALARCGRSVEPGHAVTVAGVTGVVHAPPVA